MIVTHRISTKGHDSKVSSSLGSVASSSLGSVASSSIGSVASSSLGSVVSSSSVSGSSHEGCVLEDYLMNVMEMSIISNCNDTYNKFKPW
jgi:hypothetical protein